MAKIKKFKIDTSHLRPDEVEALDILSEVGKIIHKIWEKQVIPATNTITLYDKGITRDEVTHAAEVDKDILSPYTVVRRGDDGSLYAVPYTQEYKEEISEIINLLKQVEKVSKDFWFKRYIKTIYRCWEKGDWDSALVEYLRNDNHRIGILMGPLETYADKVMGIKKAFQFNLRVKRDKDTSEVEKMVDMVKKYPVLKPYLSISRNMGEDKVFMRVDDVVMFSGRQAGTRSASTNLPNEAHMVKRYGTRVVVYRNSLDEKFEELFLPHIRKITGQGFVFNEETMKMAAARLIILHEISEGLIKFPDAEIRLKNNEVAVGELNAYLMGVKSASYHMIKGLLTEREFNEIVIMLLVVGLDKLSRMEGDTSVYEYARGFAVVFNYLEQTGAITISNKKLKIDLERVVTRIDALSSVVLSIYHESKFEESDKLFEAYGSFDIAKRLPLLKI